MRYTHNEKITVFHAQKTKLKNPVSIYNDNTFIFETYDTTSNKQMFDVMVSQFILNIPLFELSSPVRTFRRQVNLEQYYRDCQSYFILDIDDVKSNKDMQSILSFFKDYKCILGESKSHNGMDNFNLKGILFCECVPFTDAKLAISELHHILSEYCKMDECVARKASLNAPILKNNVFLNNEEGVLYKFTKKDAHAHIDAVKKEYTDNDKVINIKDFENIEADSIEKLCLKSFQMMGFQALRTNENGSITFKHENEKKSPGGYFWFNSSPYTMHHANTVKGINIFDTIRKLPQAKELMKKDINYEDEFQQFNVDTKVISVNEKYLKVTPKIEQSTQEFLNNKDGLLSIRSPMGTGKSTIIKHIIEEAHHQDMKVLIVTNRISVAHDFGKKYNIKVYNIDNYEIGDSLICQFDSLWRYNIKLFDVVIMDEFISLMMHSRSNLSNSSLNVSKFFGAFNKKLVIADAFLTGYENFLLNNKKDNIHMIDNAYRDPTVLCSYTDFNYFVDTLVYTAQRHKCTVSATSLSFINSLQMLLQKKGLTVVTLTANTPQSTKELIYGLFEKDEHNKWDVLIYSPTLTVGVSNLNNTPYHFHYDGSLSTDVISSIQMIKRTRKTKEIHLFVKERINYLKTSYNSIRDEYMGNIGKNISQNYLFDTDDYGEARLSSIGKKAIKIDTFKNILEFNHKEATFWLMKYHFMKAPRVIEKTFSGNILSRFQKIIREDANTVLKNNVEQFLTLNAIDKTALLEDTDADKTLQTLALIDDNIKECNPQIKTQILEAALKDKQFITKCKYFKVAFNYTKKIWDASDVKHLVSKAVIGNYNDDLHFYNVLLNYGQNEIFDEYLPKTINLNKHLKSILDKCGYRITRQNDPTHAGHRGYVVNPKVKELYGFIR